VLISADFILLLVLLASFAFFRGDCLNSHKKTQTTQKGKQEP